MINGTRHKYLDEIWKKYPEAPRNMLKSGRVHQLRCGVQSVASQKPVDSGDFQGADILADGDLIGLLPAGQFILLAPNLTGSSHFHPADLDPWVRHKLWLSFLEFIEKFFLEKRFLRGRSPILVDCPGTEPSIEVFKTTYQLGSKTNDFFLATSPELNLKKLLSLGAERLFEIAPVFRNGEQTERHRFQFHMLEWYRAFAPLSAIKHDVIELLEQTSQFFKIKPPIEVLTFSIPELFKKHLNFDLKPETSIDELKALATAHGVDVTPAQVIDDYFYLIFSAKIEFTWPADRLVFIEKYPPYQAALARIGADGWAERFEVYYQGLELGNAFHELTDPELQHARALEDLEKKKQLGRQAVRLDEEFFYALKFGMPPASGIAVGLERLFMAQTKVKDIHLISKVF